MRIPLYSKVLVWLGLNLVLCAVVAYAFTAPHASGLNALLTRSARQRTYALGRSIAAQAVRLDRQQRTALLRQFSAEDGVTWSLTEEPPPTPPRLGASAPPMPLPLPPGALAAPDAPGAPRGFPPGIAFFNALQPNGALQQRETVQVGHSGGYDVVMDTVVPTGTAPLDRVEVTAHCDDFMGLLRFLGINTVLLLVAVLLLISGLWWWPFVWNVSHALRDLRAATQQMSRGHLQTRVEVARRDELGDLGRAVNVMAERLESYLQGQRQFIADVAHEVTSPVARMQIGLEILEERLAGREAQAIADLREDIEQMAEMLNELLLFSRSGLEAARSAPRAVAVAATVNGILHTDCQNVLVRVDVPDELQVLVHAPLFRRALSNLLRNARHYAALSEGGIEVIARGEQGRVRIAVQDRGPGVPDYALAHLGEPFFRPERSRTRATGGFGLGLAIVRRCVEASGGAVAFRNRDGGGFEAELDLPAAIAP